MYKNLIKFHKNMNNTFSSVLSEKQDSLSKKKYKKKKKYPALVEIPFETKIIVRRKELV